jgi:hypothetical protein
MADSKYYGNGPENDPRISDAIAFLRWAAEADTTNRTEALDDLKFAGGDQWPVTVQNSRQLESRPCLTINKVDAYCRQIANQQRQQRPRMRAHGMNNESDGKMAEIVTGICRHIETQSNADHAYDTAFDFAVRMGWGYMRVTTDYARPDTFDQEIYIKSISNPFTVYFDPNSEEPDGSDAEKCLITTKVSKEAFEKMYPGQYDLQGFTQRGTGDSDAEWVDKHDVRIAEYFYTRIKKVNLLLLSNGMSKYEDEVPDLDLMAKNGIGIVSKRPSWRKTIEWIKCTSFAILEEGTWPGKYIPIVPVYGQQLTVDSKRKKFGLVRMAKDPQRMYNYWTTATTEAIALAPRAKWIMAEGQDEGHENEWAQANNKAFSYLTYKQTDVDGREAPPPIRQSPEAPPAGIMEAAAAINADLQAVVGIFDPSQLPNGQQSGKAINGMQMQIDMVNFNYYDNLTRSISQIGRIILDLIPKIYDNERVIRIIGDDEKPEIVTINQPSQDEQGIQKILNDVTVGEYDIVMETGPGYSTKRQEAVESMMPLLAADPQLMQVAGDLVFRNMDFPGAEVIADRLAATNPLAKIDEKSDIPPQVQMQLAQAQQTIQQLQQQLQQEAMDKKYRATVQQQVQEAETDREKMRISAKAHDTTMINETKREIEEMRDRTLREIENMKADIALALAKTRELSEASEQTTDRAI